MYYLPQEHELTRKNTTITKIGLLNKVDKIFIREEKLIFMTGPILSVFPALIVHSELESVHPGFPVAFIF